MTRKRFVKLLMAEGYSRNSANTLADDVIADGYSYAEGYAHITRLLPLIEKMVDPLADAVEKATEAICRFGNAVSAAASAAVQAFNAAMSQT